MAHVVLHCSLLYMYVLYTVYIIIDAGPFLLKTAQFPCHNTFQLGVCLKYCKCVQRCFKLTQKIHSALHVEGNLPYLP